MSSTSPTPRAPVSDEHAARLVATVTSWYADASRELPWREGRTDAWGVLVSEIMLQQTPVVRVLPAWRSWMRRWPTPADLAAAAPADVLQQWDRLGYPRRALRLQDCARTIVDHHDGQVPRGEERLRALPGIGEYTAAAVTAFAHHGRALVADTNIRRVLVRAIAGRAQPAASYTAQERGLIASVLPAEQERSVRWNQAVMELGALVCTARSPSCDHCPLAGVDCAWFAAGRPVSDAPRRRVQKFAGTDRQMRGQIMAVLREDHTLSAQGVRGEDLLALDPQDEGRVRRCLESLLADGLARRSEDGMLRLP